MKALKSSNWVDLPVVGPPIDGAYYVLEGTYTITVPAGAQMVSFICKTGTAYVMESQTDAEVLPTPWPPASNETTGFPWAPLAASTSYEYGEYAVAPGQKLRLSVLATSSVQVLFS